MNLFFRTLFNSITKIHKFADQVSSAVQSDYDEFSPFTIMNAQVTKYYKYWNIYLGAENLTNFRQENPVAGANDTYGQEFDATNIWGSVIGRRIYLGLRFNLNYQ